MLFANPGTATVRKRIGKTWYACEPGGIVEIPDALAYVIAAEGTLLVPAEQATQTPEPVVAVSDKTSERPSKRERR